MQYESAKEVCVKLAVVFLAGAAVLSADALSVGVRGGVPPGDAFESARSGNFTLRGHNRFIIGPTIELRLPMGLGVSFDVLYRRYAFESEGTSQSAAQWEFPLMVRYFFPTPVVRPFLAAGPTFNKLTGVTSIRSSTVGFGFGGGLDIKIPFFHVTPEVRFSRIFQENRAGPSLSRLTQNQNRVDVLVGFTF